MEPRGFIYPGLFVLLHLLVGTDVLSHGSNIPRLVVREAHPPPEVNWRTLLLLPYGPSGRVASRTKRLVGTGRLPNILVA